ILLDKWVGRTTANGFSVFKLKISGDIEADKTYLSRIYEKLKNVTEGFTIRLDGNQGTRKKHSFRLSIFLHRKTIKLNSLNSPCQKQIIRASGK
ncbi:MAG: hypothetical protein WCQ90_08255, partial [Deltaproteobacteria bacterium]